MVEFTHRSVLAGEVLRYLKPVAGETYCDGTLGGAGHAAAVLDAAAPDGRLIGLDRDPRAIAVARERLARFGDRAQVVHARYSELQAVLQQRGIDGVDGILLDLGVSSPQLDVAERGFSFGKDGPLDMRMDDTTGPTALELLRRLAEPELADLIVDLGEERHGRKIARRIKEALKTDALHTTSELAKLITECIPVVEQRKSKIHPATRTFQALRIAVNAELDELTTFLADFPALLKPGGRCVIISFHSLEDRLVKQRFRDLAWTSGLPPKFAREAGERVEAVCEPLPELGAKAVFAGDEELEHNPRARSARLRACQRTSAPNLPSHANA